MKIGMSTACFYPLELEKGIEQLHRLGVTVVEVFINTESEFDGQFVKSLREKLDTYDMEAISVHPYTSPMEGQLLFSDYPRRTKDGLEQYDRYCEAACTLGAKYLTFHGERSVIQDKSAEDLARKVESYHRLCEHASTYQITIAQENVAWCKSESPEYCKMLHDRVPELGFTLDIKQAHRAGHHWSEFLQAIGDRLCNVHINDFDDTHSCLLPGEGVMDYSAFFARLRELGYDGQTLIEVYAENYRNLEQVLAALTFLQKYK